MTARPTRADLRTEVDHLRELVAEKDAEIRALEATLHIEKAAHNLVWDLYRSAEADVAERHAAQPEPHQVLPTLASNVCDFPPCSEPRDTGLMCVNHARVTVLGSWVGSGAKEDAS
jgi:hypothetical protein